MILADTMDRSFEDLLALLPGPLQTTGVFPYDSNGCVAPTAAPTTVSMALTKGKNKTPLSSQAPRRGAVNLDCYVYASFAKASQTLSFHGGDVTIPDGYQMAGRLDLLGWGISLKASSPHSLSLASLCRVLSQTKLAMIPYPPLYRPSSTTLSSTSTLRWTL